MFASSLGETVAFVREYVDTKVAAAIARLIHFTYYSGNSATGTEDQVVCDQTDQDSGSYLVRRMQHFGFRSRPPKNVGAIRLGNYTAASNSVVVAEDSDRYGPGDLEDGEMALYNKTTGTEIRLKADGSITIDAGPSADVIVNGGSLKVARDTDPISVGTWTHVPASGTGVSACSLSYTPPGGAPTAITTATAISGKITDGADNFKA